LIFNNDESGGDIKIAKRFVFAIPPRLPIVAFRSSIDPGESVSAISVNNDIRL